MSIVRTFFITGNHYSTFISLFPMCHVSILANKCYKVSTDYTAVLSSLSILDLFLASVCKFTLSFIKIYDTILFYFIRHAQFSADKDKPTLDGHSRHISVISFVRKLLIRRMKHVIESVLCTLQKIIEKYLRNEDIPACKDVAVREFAFLGNEIHVQFHYDRDQITRATRTFIKPSMADRGDRLAFDPTMTHGYNVNSSSIMKIR